MAQDDTCVIKDIASLLEISEGELHHAFNDSHRHVRTVLRRQYWASIDESADSAERPVCRLRGLKALAKALGRYSLLLRLLTIARVYDEAHIALCKARSLKRKNRQYNKCLLERRLIDVTRLATEILEAPTRSKSKRSSRYLHSDDVIAGRIVIQQLNKETTRSAKTSTYLEAVWRRIKPISFENLERLTSLRERLPGETSASLQYAGIGGGGGSDVISASIVGALLKRHRDQAQMNMLISTRTWATGSQGKNGKVGIKREIYEHDGHAMLEDESGASLEVPGTYRVNENTHAEGRDLEAITVDNHEDVYMVLDQSESQSEIPKNEQASLQKQFQAVLSQKKEITALMVAGANPLRHTIDTVVSIDTGGDVFGAGSDGHVTPDQDYRVQEAITHLAYDNLVTAVVAPGVDAPDDAPEKAARAHGKVYTLNADDQEVVLRLLKNYRMDGTDPNRFGKTTLALQARLRGVRGWTSIDLPEYVINTWENPWTPFVFIRDCMNQIVFMSTKELLPVITPQR